MENQQSERLLPSGYEDSDYEDAPKATSRPKDTHGGIPHTRQWPSPLRLLPWFLHIIFLISYGGFILFREHPQIQVKSWPNIYSNLDLDEHVYTTVEYSKFEGRPTTETETAWHKTLSVGIVSITEEERSRLPFDTAKNVFNENEYVVEFNVFHQLHCLHDLRRQVWNPRHISWTNGEPIGWWEFHMNHCIEHLRQSLMCQADVTPQRFSWDEVHYTYALEQEQKLKCKNWQKLWDWAAVRNTTGDSPMNLKGLEKDGKISDAGEVWEQETYGEAIKKSPVV